MNTTYGIKQNIRICTNKVSTLMSWSAKAAFARRKKTCEMWLYPIFKLYITFLRIPRTPLMNVALVSIFTTGSATGLRLLV